MAGDAAQFLLKLDTAAMRASLNGARSALSGFASFASKITPFAGLLAGFASVGTAVALFKRSISEAADMESFVVSFKVLLGSAERAQLRMKELAKFAADTPFELPEVAAASRTLETLTRGVLSTGAGLTMIGDVASGTQQPFQELAIWIGRLYDGLKNGQPVGEAMQRLQELGVVSGAARRQLEELQQSGAGFNPMWKVVGTELMRFSGMMKEQSETWKGKMSTLQDSIKGVYREFGAPLIDQLKPILTGAIAMGDRLSEVAKEWGENLGNAIRTMRELFASGDLWEAAGLKLKIAFLGSAKELFEALSAGFDALLPRITRMLKGLGYVFQGLAMQLEAAIISGLATALSNIKVLGTPMISARAAAERRAGAKSLSRAGANLAALGIDQTIAAVPGGQAATTFMNEGLARSQSRLTGLEAKARLKALYDSSMEARKRMANNPISQAIIAWTNAMLPPRQPGDEFRASERNMSPKERLAALHRRSVEGSRSMADNPVSQALQAASDAILPGGPKGQRAAEDTAKNTSEMVKLLQLILGGAAANHAEGAAVVF